MERLKLWINEHKKQTIALVVVAALCVCGGIGAAVALSGNDKETITEKEPEKEEELEEVAFTAEDLSGVVTGLDGETYILAGSELDLLSLLAYDDAIITGISASDADLSVAGDVSAEYTFTVNAKALCAFLGKDFPENGAEESTIVITKPIRVVDQITAQSLADAGTVVYNGTGSTVAKTDGTAITAEVAAPKSTASTGGSSKAGNTAPKATTNKSTASTGTSNKGSSNGSGSGSSSGTTASGNTGSSGNSGGSGNSGTTTKPSGSGSSNSGGNSSGTATKPSGGSSSGNSGSGSGSSGGGATSQPHTHSWTVQSTEHHDATGHWETVVIEEAYDEPIWSDKAQAVCKVCGFTDADAMVVADHCLYDCGGAGYEVKKVLLQTIHHEAVTEQKWVQDSAAYDIITYVCSCGQTKTERKNY